MLVIKCRFFTGKFVIPYFDFLIFQYWKSTGKPFYLKWSECGRIFHGWKSIPLEKNWKTDRVFLSFPTQWMNQSYYDPKITFLNFQKGIGYPLSQSIHGERIWMSGSGLFKNDQRARGPYSNRKLGFHTDRCDVIGFLCLQPAANGGENQIVSSESVQKIVSGRSDLHDILLRLFPYKRHVIDFLNSLPYCLQPIFSITDGFFCLFLFKVLIERAHQDPDCPNLSNLQMESIDFLDSVCERKEIQTRITLKRGDLLFLNNWTTLHRRTSFEDFPEEDRKRHFLRVWLSMPDNRPLTSLFMDNFGSVAAGQIRGGNPNPVSNFPI